MTATAAPTAPTVLRPPAWVRGWAVTVAIIAVLLVAAFGYLAARGGHWIGLVPLGLVLLLALGMAWRIGGLVTRVEPDGRLLVRNRAATRRLTRAEVKAVTQGERPGPRQSTPVVVLALKDGSELMVDATLGMTFAQARLDAQIATLRRWLKG